MRGVPLQQRAIMLEERMQRMETKTSLITPEIKNTWNLALNAPIDIQPTWLHGDLHPRNILVENGVITGIIDWGDYIWRYCHRPGFDMDAFLGAKCSRTSNG
ncbi:MAG: phosphotransferase [Heteroscytonema crispum UTEX LB 1556]